MSDFGALEVNWRPTPQAGEARQTSACTSRFLAKRENLGFCCLNCLILCLLVTSKSCNIHDLHHHFLMKPTSVNCSKLSISQYKQRVMIWTSRYIQKQRCPGPKLICKTKPKVIVRLSSQIQHMMKRKRNFLVHPGKILKFGRSKASKIASFYI